MYMEDDFLFWNRVECENRLKINENDLRAIFRLGILDLGDHKYE